MLPDAPKARIFLDGYGGANPSYPVHARNLYIKYWLDAASVGIYVRGRPGEPRAAVKRRIDPYWPRFKEAFEEIAYYSLYGWWCTMQFDCEGGMRNFENWGAAAVWLEERRKKYEEILGAPP